MKNIAIKISFVLLALLIAFTGCDSPDSSGEGKLRVVIENDRTRGITMSDYETSYYVIRIENTAKNFVKEIKLPPTDTDISVMVPSGSVWVIATAFNKDDMEIGHGEKTVTVSPNRENTAAISIKESSGKGLLDVTVIDPFGLSLVAKAYLPGQTSPAATAPIVEGKARLELNSGFYIIEIAESESGKVWSTPQSVRIGTGFTSTYDMVIEDSLDIKITIQNEIVKNPSITLTKLGYVVPGANITVDAVVEGIDGAAYAWYFDGNVIPGQTSAKLDYTLPANGEVSYGRHEITLVASNSTVTWTESVSLEVWNPADRPQSVTLSEGDYEIVLVGNALLPSDLSVECVGVSGKHRFLSSQTSKLKPSDLSEGEELSFRFMNNPGNEYSYYIETEKKGDTDVIFCVIDRFMENPGYIDLSFEQKFEIPERDSHDIELADESGSIWFFSVNGYEKNRTVKAESGTYRYSRSLGTGWAEAHKFDVSTEPFPVESGKHVSYVVGSEPFATVNAVMNGIADEKILSLTARHTWYSQLRTRGGKVSFDLPISTYDDLALTSEYSPEFEYWKSGEVVLHEGANDIVFNKVEPKFIETGIAVNRGDTVQVIYKNESPAPYLSSDLLVGTDEMHGTHPGEGMYAPVKIGTGGNLRLLPILLDEYDIRYTHSSKPGKTGNDILITVTLKLKENIGVACPVAFDFAYDASTHPLSVSVIYSCELDERLLVNTWEGMQNLYIKPGTYQSWGAYALRGNEVSERVYFRDDWTTVTDGSKTIHFASR